MTSQELFNRVRRELNRPPDDDFLSDDEVVWDALRDAETKGMGLVAEHAPWLIATTRTLSAVPNPNYEQWELPEYPAAGLELWTPPGVGTGFQLVPRPPGPNDGFRLAGKMVYLNTPRAYSALYAVMASRKSNIGPALGQDPLLPEYMHPWLALTAATTIAMRPGSRINWTLLEKRANALWAGDPTEPSERGILGSLEEQAALYGEAEDAWRPWYRRIPA